jgi:hypothetical protein
VIAALLAVISTAAVAQDVRGLEICTAEKDMARRTGCLQANAEYLQQELMKLRRSAQKAVEDERAAAAKEVAALRSDLAALKAALEKTQGEVAELKKPKPAVDKEKK